MLNGEGSLTGIHWFFNLKEKKITIFVNILLKLSIFSHCEYRKQTTVRGNFHSLTNRNNRYFRISFQLWDFLQYLLFALKFQ